MSGEPLEGNERYKKIRELNSGSFAFVQHAYDTYADEEVAIKFLERGEKITQYVEREALNHRKLYHPHIIQFREIFLTPRHLGIAMEYAPGGDLFEYVVSKGGLREDQARWFFQQLIIAVDYCHKQGVVMRDIKLENSLLDGSPRPLLKLCDFGYSKAQEQSCPKSKVGTPGYIAPEVIMNTQYDGKGADIWSCGVMLFVMLVGAYPFERPGDKHDPQKLQKQLQRILAVEYVIPEHLGVSAECQDLLRQILVADPTRRLGMDGIIRHPWFLTGLPPGVMEMNDSLPDPGDDIQSESAIRAIMEEAKRTPDRPKFGAGNMEYLDAAVDDAFMSGTA